MANLLEEYTPPRRCRRGDIVKGVVVRADSKNFLVDIGGKCDAVVHPREVERMSPAELQKLNPGKVVNVFVVDADNSSAIVVSLAKAAQERDWEEAAALLDGGELIELEVVDSNKGGLIVNLGKLRGFVPGSQLMPTWRPRQNPEDPNRRWEALVGETLKLRVIEVTPERNRLILSERRAHRRKVDKRSVLEDLEIGAVEEGMVSNIVDFGAFVNVNGVDGLLHISELSWQRVNHPSEVVQPGQKIKVEILDIDLDKERLNLSLKRLKNDPWDSVTEVYREGQVVKVKIVNLTSFGAFACPVDNPAIEGLIHISELSERQISRAEEIVSVGEECLALILSLRPEDRRIAFSLKEVEPDMKEDLNSTQTSEDGEA
ncbi:MAG: 30S ribosomal protein S1 [Anaerolineales bacterium]